MSPDFYFFQASFRSRLNHPYPRAERDFEKALRCFLVFSSRKVPRQMQRLKTRREGNSPGKRQPLPSQQKHTTRDELSHQKIPLPPSTRNLSQERTSLLGQIERLTLSRKSSLNCRLVLISASPLKLPFHPPFEILHLPAGTFRSDARRKPSPLMRLRGGRGYGDGDLE